MKKLLNLVWFVLSTLPVQSPNVILRSVRIVKMPYMSNEVLRAKLAEYGEIVPRHFTGIQLRARLAELQIGQGASPDQTLKDHMSNLKRAARKKSDLQDLCRQWHVPVNGNETIAILFARMEQAMHEATPPALNGMEAINFGKHGDKTMIEVWHQDHQYLQWCQTMVAGGETCWRMKRLVQWYQAFHQDQIKKGVTTKVPPAPYNPKVHSSGASSTNDSEYSLVSAVVAKKEEEVAILNQKVNQKVEEVMLKADEVAALRAENEKLKANQHALLNENAEMTRTLDRVKTRLVYAKIQKFGVNSPKVIDLYSWK